jgi:hypothetical protein
LAAPSVPTISQVGNSLTAPAGAVSYLWILNGDTLSLNTRTITAPQSGSYVVVVFNVNGCSRASAPKNVTITSVEETLVKNGVILFPNPAESYVWISTETGPVELVGIFTPQGRRLDFHEALSTGKGLKLDIRILASGNYWIQVKSRDRTTVFPLLKD